MPSSCLPCHRCGGDEERPHQAQPVKDLAQVARGAILDSLAPVWRGGIKAAGRWAVASWPKTKQRRVAQC